MKLTVFVHDKPVAKLESTDGFRHVLTYYPDARPEDFVSLLMPVRTESYTYPDLHPLFRMNLPEGFLLSVLQQELGPEVGASPLNLLAIVGRNAIGRVKVAREGADPSQPPMLFEVDDILTGDNSEEAFIQLVRRYAVSGVSGIVPKFLSPAGFAEHGKGTGATDRYIVKGTTDKLPGIALNEHLCLKVAAAAGIPTARTRVSADGQALLVERFDVAGDGATRKGMEDFCSLLALRPEEKYQASWEKVVGRLKDVVRTPAQQNAALSQLADQILLTYALRNADCHTKNVALLYSSATAIELAPVYDMLTITAYADYAQNSPGLTLAGRRTWRPGKSLEIFLQERCGVRPAQTYARAARICAAMTAVAPEVLAATDRHPAFREVGKRMLLAWNDGMQSLKLEKSWQLPDLTDFLSSSRLSEPERMRVPRNVIGRSNLLPDR
jgi:serine/threonine-protein kinase HipA